MPLPFPCLSTVRRAALATVATAALTASVVPAISPAASARASEVATGATARTAVVSVARPSLGRAGGRSTRKQRTPTGRRARAARRRAATVERRTRRAHLPQTVRTGKLPAARAPLGGLATAVPGLLTPAVDAVTGALLPTGPTIGSPSTPPAPTPEATPTPVPVPAVGVLLRETPSYTATLSRTTVPAGQVRLQLQNAGEDPHDLRVERTDDGSTAGTFTSTDPGSSRTRTLTLATGSYRLYCSFTAPVVHAGAGMRATLVVSG